MGTRRLPTSRPLKVDDAACDARALEQGVGKGFHFGSRVAGRNADGGTALLEPIEMLATKELLGIVDHPGIIDSIAELVASVAEHNHGLIGADETTIIEIKLAHRVPVCNAAARRVKCRHVLRFYVRGVGIPRFFSFPFFLFR